MELQTRISDKLTRNPLGDLLFIFEGRYFVLDFVVTSPVGKSIVLRACKENGIAAADAERGKVSHYLLYYKNMDKQPHAITPCAMETFGTLGARYHHLIRAIGDAAFPNAKKVDTDALRSRYIETMRQHASVTLARIVSVAFTSWRMHLCPPGQ
jgi:hypothetical protein